MKIKTNGPGRAGSIRKRAGTAQRARTSRRDVRAPAGIIVRIAVAVFVTAAPLVAADDARVTLLRTPDRGLQPQAVVDGQGTVHLVFLKGDPKACDVFYTRRDREAPAFARPIRVNSQPGSAVAAGTIRGAQLAVGREGRVHVVWNGSHLAQPKPARGAPLLYARLADGAAFEPQRNLITFAVGLDGGGSVAADGAGNVYVVWHGAGEEGKSGEVNRAVFVAHAGDDGKSFAAERRASREPTGACGCCGLRAMTDANGALFVFYRAAARVIQRDMILLASRDRGASFDALTVDRWTYGACPMSSAWLAQGRAGMLAAWETREQVHASPMDAGLTRPSSFITPPGVGKRKHPVLIENQRGERLFVWTDGTGWQKGGAVSWQVFGPDGQPTAAPGRAEGVPVWSFAAAFAAPDGSFTIVY